MDTSPVNEPLSLGAFDGGEVGEDGTGEKVGAVGALEVSESGVLVSPSAVGDLVPIVSALGAFVSSAGSALGDLVPPAVGESTKLGAFVPPAVDESTIVGDSVSLTVGALL
jgi:hypothetical protein